MVLLFVLSALLEAGVLPASALESTSLQFVVNLAAYVLTLGFIVVVYQALYGTIKDKKSVFAIKRKPRFSDLYYTVVGFAVYIVCNFAVFLLLATFVPGFDFDEKQNVGFQAINSQFEYILAFVALVLLAPFAEEALFRGFLFTKVREKLHFWPTAIIVSLLFGLVHLQWNVGVDVFVLSLVLCYLREKTKAIWSGVAIHMIKNLIAYTVVFLNIF